MSEAEKRTMRMGNADHTRDGLSVLRAEVPAGRPIALVNLLLFEDEVVWDQELCTGRDLYGRYIRAVMPALVRSGGRPAFYGRCGVLLDGPSGERWDEVVIVYYPSRECFERFLGSDEFRAASRYRSAALADARLIAVSSPRRIGRLLAAIVALGTRVAPRGPRSLGRERSMGATSGSGER